MGELVVSVGYCRAVRGFRYRERGRRPFWPFPAPPLCNFRKLGLSRMRSSGGGWVMQRANASPARVDSPHTSSEGAADVGCYTLSVTHNFSALADALGFRRGIS